MDEAARAIALAAGGRTELAPPVTGRFGLARTPDAMAEDFQRLVATQPAVRAELDKILAERLQER